MIVECTSGLWGQRENKYKHCSTARIIGNKMKMRLDILWCRWNIVPLWCFSRNEASVLPVLADFGERDYSVYQEVNLPLWVDYQDGRITAAQLRHARFWKLSSKLETTTAALNGAFLYNGRHLFCFLVQRVDGVVKSQSEHGHHHQWFHRAAVNPVWNEQEWQTTLTMWLFLRKSVSLNQTRKFWAAHWLIGLPSKQSIDGGDNLHSDIF